MKLCNKCGESFPRTVFIDGIKRNINNRVYCLKCSPFRAGKNPEPIVFRANVKRSWDEAKLVTAVANNVTISGVIRALGLSISPGNFKTINKYCRLLCLDTSHMTGRPEAFKGNAQTLEQILVEHSTYSKNSGLRRRLIKEGILTERCAECNAEPVWNGKKLVLQLDHINGIPDDNRVDNLRLLCPNCHSQTETHSRSNKGIGRYKKFQNHCVDCNDPIGRTSVRCLKCQGVRNIAINWPNVKDLEQEVMSTSYVAVAARLGVTDNAVRKHLRKTLGRAIKKNP